MNVFEITYPIPLEAPVIKAILSFNNIFTPKHLIIQDL
jgi:hypothetical protein